MTFSTTVKRPFWHTLSRRYGLATVIAFGVAAVAFATATYTPLFYFNLQGQPIGLTEVTPGLFYGATRGLVNDPGSVIYSLTSAGKFTPLHLFVARGNPIQVVSFLQAVNGRFYGNSDYPTNILFSSDLHGNVTTYSLAGLLEAPLFSLETPDGFIYGVLGNSSGVPDYGEFIQMDLAGQIKILHSFTASEGSPYRGVIRASDGNFYGHTVYSSSPSNESVFRMTPQGEVTTLVTYVNNPSTSSAGAYPTALIQASNGKLYGTSALGGTNQAGTVYEMSLEGQFRTIYNFPSSKVGIPQWLMEASDGNIYGLSEGEQDQNGFGTLFRIANGGAFTQVFDFPHPNREGACICQMTQGSDGKLYITAQLFGLYGAGGAFVMDLGLPKPLPSIGGFSPASGPVGTKVLLYGKNFVGANSVTFNGASASVVTDIGLEYVTAEVPAGATSGPVTVVTPNGTAVSAGSFTVE